MTATHLASRAVVRLSPQEAGEDVAGFLQGLVTNDVVGGDVVAGPLPAYAALLTAQGKVIADMIVWRDGGDLLLDCAADAAPALARRLSLYRLRRKIAIAVDDALAVHWSPDPRPGATQDPRLAALGWRWLAAPSGAPADAVWLAHRLSLGVAEGAELTDLLWLETNAAELNGVSFTKGCYVGQENTARMNWRQKVNRRLVVVPLAASDPARRRAAWPDLALALDHRRVEDIPAGSVPVWLAPALAPG